jgi:hypothetical protein
MPGYDRDQLAIDNTVENRHLGSVMITLGWILLWFDALVGVFFFQSLRDGSMWWPIWIGVQGFIGVALVIAGTRYRRALGMTRLGHRDMERTEAEVRRERAEQKHVA